MCVCECVCVCVCVCVSSAPLGRCLFPLLQRPPFWFRKQQQQQQQQQEKRRKNGPMSANNRRYWIFLQISDYFNVFSLSFFFVNWSPTTGMGEIDCEISARWIELTVIMKMNYEIQEWPVGVAHIFPRCWGSRQLVAEFPYEIQSFHRCVVLITQLRIFTNKFLFQMVCWFHIPPCGSWVESPSRWNLKWSSRQLQRPKNPSKNASNPLKIWAWLHRIIFNKVLFSNSWIRVMHFI